MGRTAGGPRLTVRLVALDVDGTLTRSDGTVSATTTAALQGLRMPYVLVTGRPRRWVDDLAASLGSSGAAIVANGALTYDLATGAVIAAVELEPAVALACASAIRDAVPDALFAAERHDGFAAEPGYPSIAPDPTAPVQELTLLLRAPALKVLCRSTSTLSADDLYARALAVCGGHPVTLTHSTGATGLLEIAAAGVDKAVALKAYAASLGIAAAEVMAVGDGFNDVPMLRWAGRGVAMANAHPTAIEAADEVTPASDDDGLATLLASL